MSVSNFIFVLSWSNRNCHFQFPFFISCQHCCLVSDQQHSSFLLALDDGGIFLVFCLGIFSASLGVKIHRAHINSNTLLNCWGCPPGMVGTKQEAAFYCRFYTFLPRKLQILSLLTSLLSYVYNCVHHLGIYNTSTKLAAFFSKM